MRGRRLVVPAIAVAVLGAIGLALVALSRNQSPTSDPIAGHRLAGIVRQPFTPRQQTALAFGDRSHWLQPWRGYLDTPPAAKLRDAIGININVPPREVPALARLLRDSGFKRARYEIGWGGIDFAHPDRLTNAADIRTVLTALRDNGIRPLILLNANAGLPCPTRAFMAKVLKPGRHGARTLTLDHGTVAQISPGRTGLNSLTSAYKAADVLFTSVHGNVATLSKPLPRDLAPGAYPAATLRYAPFGPPKLPGSRTNPEFEQTMAGWLRFVGTVTRTAKKILGSQNFDIEVWNELTFGSDFLNQASYYEPPKAAGAGDVPSEIITRTVKFIRDPSNGVSSIGIGDGFESQRPFASGATVPRGLTAIDKHPYSGRRRFPDDAKSDANGIRPLDAAGRTAGRPPGSPTQPRWQDDFVPSYTAFFPEYYLTAIQTEHAIRDVSPITTDVYGTPHGRTTHPPQSFPPTMWVTEWNMDPAGANLANPSDSKGGPLNVMTAADSRHMRAKAVLRFLTAWVNKGATAVDFYAAKDPRLGLVDPAFFRAVDEEGGAYPGSNTGGETMDAVRRLTHELTGAEAISKPCQLSLDEIGDYSGHKQFAGDGKPAHPPLYDRDVVGFFPYQISANRFIVAVYVMTRNLAQRYRDKGASSDPRRFDLPDEPFRLRVGGLPGAADVKVTATDPLAGHAVERLRVVQRTRSTATIDLPLTDSPRLLVLDTGARTPAHQLGCGGSRPHSP